MTGTSALVIGCTGTTETVCRLLLEQGAAHVGIVSGDVENLCATNERLADSRVVLVHADIGSRAQLQAALDVFRGKAGKVDLIINSSGLLAA